MLFFRDDQHLNSPTQNYCYWKGVKLLHICMKSPNTYQGATEIKLKGRIKYYQKETTCKAPHPEKNLTTYEFLQSST